MKLLFTKLQEEITTVKKSVTQFRLETGSDSKTAEFPVIELKPESSRVVHREAVESPEPSFSERRAPLQLSAKAEQIADIVDLQGASKKSALSPVTYSATGALKAKPNLEYSENYRLLKSDNDHKQEKISVNRKPDQIATFSTVDEKQAKYQFTTRKFIATQEMIEFHKSREKRISFELTI